MPKESNREKIINSVEDGVVIGVNVISGGQGGVMTKTGFTVGNITDFFGKTNFGKNIKDFSQKTNFRQGKDYIYKIMGKTNNPNLKKGDYYHLDSKHGNHIEVYDRTGKSKAVLDLDGNLNITKTKTAEGKIINVN